jgi:short-subunit dehydrogenase
MDRLHLAGKWVLVTGASSGLGQSMAQLLAKEHRANLVVVARRRERLEALKQELEAAHGVRVRPVVADLCKLEDVDRVLTEATNGIQLQSAILNAGVTYFGEHAKLEWSAFEAMLHTNVTSIVRLSNGLVPHLIGAPDGALMLVSSMAGLTPVPYQTAYSGTKAFLNAFGEGLWHELKGQRISVTTYSPGGIETEMTATDSFEPLQGWLIPVERAAREGLDALVRRKRLHVPGALNRAALVAMQLLPNRLTVGQVAATYRNALQVTSRAAGKASKT